MSRFILKLYAAKTVTIHRQININVYTQSRIGFNQKWRENPHPVTRVIARAPSFKKHYRNTTTDFVATTTTAAAVRITTLKHPFVITSWGTRELCTYISGWDEVSMWHRVLLVFVDKLLLT